MQPIAEALARVTLGTPSQFQNLAVFPLLAADDRRPDYVLLDEALARKLARVTEVSESGHVPELLFLNDGEAKVLLIDGEELIGARQNRILNVSILVGAQQKIVVPVSCVEQGRWHYRSRHFESAGSALFAKARARKTRSVSASLRSHGSHYSNQTEIWNDISAKAAFLRVESETDSMSDIYEQHAAQLEAYAGAFAPQPGQAGALFAINGQIAGLELFDAPATFASFLPRLVRSYALDAIEVPQRAVPSPLAGGRDGGTLALVRKFLDDMQAAALEHFPALGEGEDLRIESESVAGGALFADNRVMHLCAFRVGSPAARPIGRGGTIDFEVPAFLRRGFHGR